MSKRRLVIAAVLAGSSQSKVAGTYGVSQGWISKLMARYKLEGDVAFEPRSRRPRTNPHAWSRARRWTPRYPVAGATGGRD